MTGEVEGRFKMSDGFGLYHHDWKPAGEPERVVVCFHGIEAHSSAFRFLGEELSREAIEVYAFDRRGFGNSKEPALPRGDTADFSRHLRDIEEVVGLVHQSHPGKKLFLLGHSLGCAYVLWYAATHRNVVDGLVLAAPPVVPNTKLPLGDAVKFGFLLLLAPRTMFDFVGKWPEPFRNSEEFKLLAGDPLCTRMFSVRWLFGVQRKLANKILENASKIEEPTLIVQGDMDIITLPEGAKRLLDTVRSEDRTLRTFPKADHWFFHSVIPNAGSTYDPATRREISATVTDWLNKH